jgi:hypothetical protein
MDHDEFMKKIEGLTQGLHNIIKIYLDDKNSKEDSAIPFYALANNLILLIRATDTPAEAYYLVLRHFKKNLEDLENTKTTK